MNKNILKIAGLIITGFLVNITYLTYIQVFQGDKLLNHPRNRRPQILEESVARGKILDARGNVLAKTVTSDGKKKRSYPFGEVMAHITGYESKRYGRSGLEASYNGALLGLSQDFAGNDFWSLKRFDTAAQGNDIVLSIDASLQQLAYRMLAGRKGAVVVVEPSTGRILAMVSKPAFDPRLVDSEWQQLSKNPDSPLLNRAAQGLYPPGSTMKIITAAGILTEKPETINNIFNAPGYIVIEGRRIEDRQAVGRLNFTQAFAVSSNFVFARLGIELGASRLQETARNFLLSRRIPFDLPAAEGSVPLPQSKLELGEAAIGQGRVLVSPLQMALVAAAVANKGKIMAPGLIDEISSPEGSVIWQFKQQVLSTAMQEDVAARLREFMIAAVDSGTGTEAAIPNVRMAGKTGSAQNPHGIPHAWFIGFAPAYNPKAAVAVIVENGGAGGREAAPIAREIMKAVIGKQ